MKRIQLLIISLGAALGAVALCWAGLSSYRTDSLDKVTSEYLNDQLSNSPTSEIEVAPPADAEPVQSAEADTETASAEREPSPTWELSDIAGKPVKSSDFDGKVVILDFWATWCPPCRKEIPDLVELQKQYQAQGLVIVGVSLDQGGTAPVDRFMRQMDINYPIVMGDQKIITAFGGVTSIPTTFIIDRAGQITAKHVGFTTKAAFEKEIKPLLAAAN